MTTSKSCFAPLLAIGFVVVLSTTAWACPGCKEALETAESGGDLRTGFFWSILFMLSMPPLILAGLGTAMYRAVRRARIDAAAAGASTVNRDDGPLGASIGSAG